MHSVARSSALVFLTAGGYRTLGLSSRVPGNCCRPLVWVIRGHSFMITFFIAAEETDSLVPLKQLIHAAGD